MNCLGEILKIFFEKYFVKTILSVIIATIIYIYYPVIFVEIKNSSEIAYAFFLFCVPFMIIYALHALWGKAWHKMQLNRETALQNKENYERLMEELWSYVDRLPTDTKRVLKEFIKTNNSKPYLCPPDRIYCLCITENLLVKTNFTMTNETPTDKYILQDAMLMWIVGIHNAENHGSKQWQIELVQIKLADSFYKNLKHSYEKYGKISNFD